jgi:hypothetical protein
MKYKVKCQKCSRCVFVRGVYEPDTNATVLDDNDRGWTGACEHMADGDYDILEEESDDEDYAAHDHGDSVWPK